MNYKEFKVVLVNKNLDYEHLKKLYEQAGESEELLLKHLDEIRKEKR